MTNCFALLLLGKFLLQEACLITFISKRVRGESSAFFIPIEGLRYIPVGFLKVLGETAPLLSLCPDAGEPFPLSLLAEVLGVHILPNLPISHSPARSTPMFALLAQTSSSGLRVCCFAQLELSLCPVNSSTLCSAQQTRFM